ncbi:chromosomal replication initiator protein DnaA [Christensenella tenuis]|jgi:chromosomal replication initiator protein|uniref:Chromosomal replication initiator protein DnaA n=1 Tax=Christensenella tenuis TaxID=2763033 RepID=A0ABR7EFJ5_9FIRM|nr:chromosomal replication initiator protein DnaA [Christensenella tenuis]MBC5648428.1 chromosomal replication initiator protein DnaA [Christensenella tenuis]
MSVFNILWEKTLNYLEEDLPMFQFNVWIKELKPVHEENGAYFFEVSSPMHKNLMEEKYAEKIRLTMQLAYEELYGVPGADIRPEFITPQDSSKLNISRKKEEPQPAREVKTNLNPNYTFDTFVVGEANKFANAAALAVAQAPGRAYNPLFLYGGVGLGKTHLMHAVGNHILQENPEAEIVYVTSETFMNELIRMIQLTNNRANIDLREQFRRKYRNIDVLLIDDIQFIAGKDVAQDEFFHTFNALRDMNKQIVISSDRPPKEMEKLEERMRCRFEWGLIADIKMPDYETRVAILLKKVQALRSVNPSALPIRDDTLHYIAQQKNSNIRTLEGALQKVIMYAELHKDSLPSGEIDASVAQRALEDFFASPSVRAITPKGVIDVVCEYFDIREEDIRGQKRNREYVFPRQISMFVLRDLTDNSYSKIAEFFGRDHSTIMHAEEKIKKQMKEDPELKKVVEDIEAKIKG